MITQNTASWPLKNAKGKPVIFIVATYQKFKLASKQLGVKNWSHPIMCRKGFKWGAHMLSLELAQELQVIIYLQCMYITYSIVKSVNSSEDFNTEAQWRKHFVYPY